LAILEPSYETRNKEPTEIGAQISPPNQPIGKQIEKYLRKKPFHL